MLPFFNIPFRSETIYFFLPTLFRSQKMWCLRLCFNTKIFVWVIKYNLNVKLNRVIIGQQKIGKKRTNTFILFPSRVVEKKRFYDIHRIVFSFFFFWRSVSGASRDDLNFQWVYSTRKIVKIVYLSTPHYYLHISIIK